MSRRRNSPSSSTSSTSSGASALPGLQQCLSYLQQGDVSAFARSAEELARRHPQAAKAWQMRGVAALMQGQLQQAVDDLQRAARLDQSDASIWDNLGVALQRAGHHQAAAESYQGSVRLNPDVAAVWCNAAANFGEMGDFVLARNCAARALKIDPGILEGHLNLGNALRLLGDNEPAARALLRAIELDPECAPAHMALARTMHQFQAGSDLAVKHARRALEIDPDYADARFAYAEACNSTEDKVDALRALGAHLGRGGIQLGQSLLWALLADPRESPASLFAVKRAFAERFEPVFSSVHQPHDNQPGLRRKLKVGFLSGDFRRHPVADHILPLWQGINRRKLAVHAYSSCPASMHDATTEELKALADNWSDVQEHNDAVLARQIREDGIDILIDLAGHTAFNRVAVLMRKPAPLQMHWLGYPSSTGLEVIDYLVVDPVLAPAGAEAFCSEQLLRLPSYSPLLRMPGVSTPSPLPAQSNGYITFGVTSRGDKLNEETVRLWAAVLQQLPDARLVIADAGSAEARRRLGEQFASCGIGQQRLDSRNFGSEAEYLALHGEIDILLDTFPFNGGTTVSHGLSMGVPTLTLCGELMTQRMAAARLRAVGLDDWIAGSKEEFVALAVKKAAALNELAALRSGLPARLEEIGQLKPEAFAASFEKGLRQAWQRWCEQLPPAAINIAG